MVDVIDFYDLPLEAAQRVLDRFLDRIGVAKVTHMEQLAAQQGKSIAETWAEICDIEGVPVCSIPGPVIGVADDTATFHIH